MKDNAHHCHLAGTLENLSLDPLFEKNRKENTLDYERIPAVIL